MKFKKLQGFFTFFDLIEIPSGSGVAISLDGGANNKNNNGVVLFAEIFF